jgi:uncharacterized protein
MREALKQILEIQELDMKMLRLMRVKKERQNELEQIHSLRKELHLQLTDKEKELTELGQSIVQLEQKIQEAQTKIKRLEAQQSNVKKVDEFNALTQEMGATEKERLAFEQKVSDLMDRKAMEEEILEKIRSSLKTSEESSLVLEKEIQSGIELINEEGRALKAKRSELAQTADLDLLQMYQRLLNNKKDRVIVTIENRTCSGCHIVLTAQHENLVRKGENLAFCEHCSRLHYWKEKEPEEEVAGASPKRRRRRVASS